MFWLCGPWGVAYFQDRHDARVTLGWLLCHRVCLDVVGVGYGCAGCSMRCVMMPMLVLFVCPSGCGASLCSGFVVHGVLHNFQYVMMLEGLSACRVCCIFIKCVVFCSFDRQVH